jgi:hypothetical protein
LKQSFCSFTTTSLHFTSTLVLESDFGEEDGFNEQDVLWSLDEFFAPPLPARPTGESLGAVDTGAPIDPPTADAEIMAAIWNAGLGPGDYR